MKRANKKAVASNVLNFPTLPPVKKPKTRRPPMVSFGLDCDVYGFARGDKIIVKTSFVLDELSPSALVVADNADGRNLMALSAARLTSAEIFGVVVAFEREVKH